MQDSNDGQFLESLLSSVICLSSHKNGLGGIDFQSFLKNMVFQLQCTAIGIDDVEIENIKVLGDFQFPVRYLSPANQKWPDLLHEIPDAKLGNLERTRNEKMIDLSTNCGITGESKDYSDKLDLKRMEEILERIPKDSIVHFVFTRSMQGSYFVEGKTGKTFNQIVEDGKKYSKGELKNLDHLSEFAFFKLNCEEPKTKLESITGLPDNSEKKQRFVIFCLINEKIKL